MLGLSLIHAGFLAASLAIALPIAIHLLLRQRTRSVMIGSVRFLHQVVREHRRRRRLRQWILLSLRMLAVLLLAMLFARPYWDRSQQRGLEQEVVLLVDSSASMQAKASRGESSFTRAVAKAKQELAALDDNVVVHLAMCDASGVRELPIEQLSAAQATEAATDYGLALAWARDILAASKRSNRQIVLISDLQRSGISRTRIERLGDATQLFTHDVGETLPRNVAIESAEAIRTEIRPDGPVVVRVVLRNHGPLAVRKLVVNCEVASANDEKLSGKQQTDLAALGSTILEFPLKIATDGLYRGQVSCELDDSLALDNRRYLAFEARHPDRVLLVDGQEGRSSFASETYYLETALRLQTEETSGVLRSFEPERMVWESGEGFPRLDGYRVVVLANVRRLSEADGERLNAYVRGGGSLLVFAGEQVSGESVAPLTKQGLLPGAIAAIPFEGRLRVDAWDAKHPALDCFADPQQGDLRRVEFHKIIPLDSPVAGSRVLLQTGGKVVAAELDVGKGRCLYVGTTADRDWTELPRTPMYVPLVRQLLAHLTDQLAERSAVSSVLIVKHDDKCGVAPAVGNPGRWIVTNLDPRESALHRLAPDELQQLAGVSNPQTDSQSQQASLGIKLPADSLRPDEIWPSVIWILLAVLAAETLLAGRVHA